MSEAVFPAFSRRFAFGAWLASEALAFGILSAAGWLRFTAEQVLCTLAGPLAAITSLPRFQHHSPIGNALFVLAFTALAALPFLHALHRRRWTRVLSLIAWAAWPWLGFAFTIHHM